MEYSVKFPVIFTPGGDTTSQAIGKHIDEIAAIYHDINDIDGSKATKTALAELDAKKANIVDIQPAIDKTTTDAVNAAKAEIDGKLALKANIADIQPAIDTTTTNAINNAKVEIDAKLAQKASNEALTNGLAGKANVSHTHNDFLSKVTSDNFGFKFVTSSVESGNPYLPHHKKIHLPSGGTWAWVLHVPDVSYYITGDGGDGTPLQTHYTYILRNYTGVGSNGQLLVEYLDGPSGAAVLGFCWKVSE